MDQQRRLTFHYHIGKCQTSPNRLFQPESQVGPDGGAGAGDVGTGVKEMGRNVRTSLNSNAVGNCRCNCHTASKNCGERHL